MTMKMQAHAYRDDDDEECSPRSLHRYEQTRTAASSQAACGTIICPPRDGENANACIPRPRALTS